MASDSTIGVGGDYTTIADWLASIPTDLAGQGIHIGRCLNQTFAENVNVTGFSNASATDYIHLTAADGASFADNDSNPLRYDTSHGAAIEFSDFYAYLFSSLIPYTRLTRLQLKQTSAGGYGVRINGTGALMEQCIFETTAVRNITQIQATSIRNVLLVGLDAPGSGFQAQANTEISYLTIANVSNITGSGAYGISYRFRNCQLRNNATFGFPTAYDKGNSDEGSYTNATDTAEVIDATDLINVPYSATTPFVQADSTSPLDFKLASGSPLEGAGTPSTITTDIYGNPRDPSNPSIGCYEPQAVVAEEYNAMQMLGIPF